MKSYWSVKYTPFYGYEQDDSVGPIAIYLVFCEKSSESVVHPVICMLPSAAPLNEPPINPNLLLDADAAGLEKGIWSIALNNVKIFSS